MNNDHVKDEILFRCRYSETGGMSVFTINVPRWLADKLDGVEARIHCSKITLNDSRADANSITITQIPKQKIEEGEDHDGFHKVECNILRGYLGEDGSGGDE